MTQWKTLEKPIIATIFHWGFVSSNVWKLNMWKKFSMWIIELFPDRNIKKLWTIKHATHRNFSLLSRVFENYMNSFSWFSPPHSKALKLIMNMATESRFRASVIRVEFILPVSWNVLNVTCILPIQFGKFPFYDWKRFTDSKKLFYSFTFRYNSTIWCFFFVRWLAVSKIPYIHLSI